VRTAAASLAFNISAWLQKGRVLAAGKGVGGQGAAGEDGDWEVEIVSAVIEAIGREKDSEEVGEFVLCLGHLVSVD
jgi:desumoylating isopeptidase 1